jgi:two-component system nitrogen regulation sensor histidine kinase GlnL
MPQQVSGVSWKAVAPYRCEREDDRVVRGYRLGRMVDQVATAIVLVDRDLRLIDMNSAAEHLLSQSRRQARGQEFTALTPGAPQLRATLRRALSERVQFFERDVALGIGDQRPVVVDCTVTPVNDGEDVIELLVELNNVDRLHRIQREERLLAQSTVATALVRGMAHEIKNPLGGIRGAAQLLERELNEPRLTDYTRIIVEEVDRLRGVIDRLLEPTTLATARRLNVHEVLEHVRGLVEVEIGGRPVVSVDYDPSLPEVRAVRDHLVQVFLNILRNAVEAAGTGGRITLRTRIQRMTTIGTRLHRLAVRVDVIDDGPGVAADLGATIFYPMVSGRPNGTGLGLAIAQSLVQRDGGIIEFESHPGATTFSVLLPIEHER